MMPLILPDVKFRIVIGNWDDPILQKIKIVNGDLLIDEVEKYYESEHEGFIYIQKRYGQISEIKYSLLKFRGILQALGCQIIEEVHLLNKNQQTIPQNNDRA